MEEELRLMKKHEENEVDEDEKNVAKQYACTYSCRICPFPGLKCKNRNGKNEVFNF